MLLQEPIKDPSENIAYRGRKYLTILSQSHYCSVLLFVAIELDGTTIVAHFGKGKTHHFLLFLSYSTALLLHFIVNFSAKTQHYFVADTVQVCRSHIIVNVGDAPSKTLLTVLLIVWAGLRTRYHIRI